MGSRSLAFFVKWHMTLGIALGCRYGMYEVLNCPKLKTWKCEGFASSAGGIVRVWGLESVGRKETSHRSIEFLLVIDYSRNLKWTIKCVLIMVLYFICMYTDSPGFCCRNKTCLWSWILAFLIIHYLKHFVYFGGFSCIKGDWEIKVTCKAIQKTILFLHFP